jgi:hypothetical protein
MESVSFPFLCIIYTGTDYDQDRGSSVSIVSDYGLDDRGSIPDIGTRFFP